MKSTKIQRGIQSPHARAAGDGPAIGRVARLRDPEVGADQGGLRKRGSHSPGAVDADAARRKIILRWSVILTLATVLVIGGFMMFWLRSHGNQRAGKGEASVEKNVRIVSKFVSPGETEALDLVKRALAIRDPGLVESCFHLGGATSAEVLEFLTGCEARDGKIERSDWLSSMDVDGLLMDGVLVVYAGRDRPAERLALLTPDESGVWKVDFDAFARSSRPSWKELLEGRVNRAQVRVFVGKDAYYNGPFVDESQWVCFAMASPESNELLPEGSELLRGYCRVGSPQAQAMEKMLPADVRTHRATLEISRKEGADSRQFEITRVFSEDWVLTAKPFDGRFTVAKKPSSVSATEAGPAEIQPALPESDGR